MKKGLLFTALLFTSAVNAQLTDMNEPAIGETQTMFLCDSFANPLDNVTGTGVTWDFTTLLGYPSETRTVEVVDATTTSDAASFPGATKAFQVENALLTYFSSTSSERISQGFKFTEPTMGDVLAMISSQAPINGDEQLMITYPFNNGNSFTDTYNGEVSFSFNGAPINEALTGVAYVSIDGEGTLNLPGSVSIANVIRYKSVDTATTTVPFVGVVELIRNQYEYYDLANQNLPIFLHSTITMQQPGGTPLAQTALVLSKYEAGYANLNENELASFEVYPNPATSSITVRGEFDASAKAALLDQSGRTLKTMSISNGQSIDISDLAEGMYILSIENNGVLSTQTIVKK